MGIFNIHCSQEIGKYRHWSSPGQSNCHNLSVIWIVDLDMFHQVAACFELLAHSFHKKYLISGSLCMVISCFFYICLAYMVIIWTMDLHMSHQFAACFELFGMLVTCQVSTFRIIMDSHFKCFFICLQIC